MKLVALLPTAAWSRHLLGGLRAEGHTLLVATDSDQLLRIVDQAGIGCVLVGLSTSGPSAADMCRRVRERSLSPIIALTESCSELDTVLSLELGADDYVNSGVSLAELVARVRAVTRRASPLPSEPASRRSVFVAGEVRIDVNAHVVTLRDRILNLPPREFDLLAVLVENSGRVIPRQRLLDLVWGERCPLDSKTLDVHIQRLRAKVEEDGAPRRIVTVRGVGYKFEKAGPSTGQDDTRPTVLGPVIALPLGRKLPPQLLRAAEILSEEFARVYTRETVERMVTESLDRLSESASITTFLPLFAERFARERLRAAARADQLIVTGVPEVLFVCAENAHRSQMAAAFLEHHSAGAVHVCSAGSVPANRISPAVVAAMEERGIDLHDMFPKPLTDEVIRAADVVVTMGCGEACPVYQGKRYLNWHLDDPAGKSVEEIRPIRDLIERMVKQLVGDLSAKRLSWN